MIRSCVCGIEFDDSLTYKQWQRTVGPRRKYCSMICAKKQDNEQHQRARRSILKRLYGLSLEEYEELKTQQFERCAICGLRETTVSKKGHKFSLNVDHDHQTGEVRGLLCTPCNRGLGFLRDDAEILRNAINYLERR